MCKEFPADACGAICLSFRALDGLSLNTWSTNLEMHHKLKKMKNSISIDLLKYSFIIPARSAVFEVN